jgi:nucleoside-diphosphate-sugar epimerase
MVRRFAPIGVETQRTYIILLRFPPLLRGLPVVKAKVRGRMKLRERNLGNRIMANRIFLAGASGVIGRVLAPLLIADGWKIFGTTRSAEKAQALRRNGVEPVVVDVFDAEALQQAVAEARPSIVMHQLTDLPRGPNPASMDEARARNARLREVGTRNLVAAAIRAGAGRLIAQSIAFAYAPGPIPHAESDPLDVLAPGSVGVSARGVAGLEQAVLGAGLHGIVLRYGRLYGPGTGVDTPPGPAPLHVAAAAVAARLALTRGEPGIYNIAEDDGAVDIGKARAQLGWSPREI